MADGQLLAAAGGFRIAVWPPKNLIFPFCLSILDANLGRRCT